MQTVCTIWPPPIFLTEQKKEAGLRDAPNFFLSRTTNVVEDEDKEAPSVHERNGH